MSTTEGIETYGEVAIVTMIKEFKHLVNGTFPGKSVVESIKTSDLTYKEKTKVLNAINLIKIKQNRIVKGRSCADESKDQFYCKEEESITSPTVALESLISTLIIDIYEGRDIATFNIPGAYLHVSIPDEDQVTLKFC
eukprot:15365606-Ditylum_brightwellii.AAC.1